MLQSGIKCGSCQMKHTRRPIWWVYNQCVTGTVSIYILPHFLRKRRASMVFSRMAWCQFLITITITCQNHIHNFISSGLLLIYNTSPSWTQTEHCWCFSFPCFCSWVSSLNVVYYFFIYAAIYAYILSTDTISTLIYLFIKIT